jgi:signal transduction histidine kinase
MAVVCNLENDAVNAPIGAIALTLGTAAFIPWTMREQIQLVAVATIAVMGNQIWLGVLDEPIRVITVTTALLTFGATIAMTSRLEAAREASAIDEARRRAAENAQVAANADLERRVEERTAELDAAVAELQAFTYSVSHDLRSPLRAINGMSQMLEDEHAEGLGKSGVAYLARLKRASRRMDQLIDALLSRSRVGQAELSRRPIDLVVLGDRIIEDLHRSAPERALEFIRPDRLATSADRTLTTVVLQHLLGNAWKFTRSRDVARIELGRRRGRYGEEFFVRDNGVGFSMGDSGKLFENFQRLHGEEYEGTGIGLATVGKVAARHGGWVRIESEIDDGTTVSFSLEPANASTAPGPPSCNREGDGLPGPVARPCPNPSPAPFSATNL